MFIPYDIFQYILGFVRSLQNLCRCRTVCKMFRDIIDSLYVGHGLYVKGTEDDTYLKEICSSLSTFPIIDRLYISSKCKLYKPMLLRDLNGIRVLIYNIAEEPFDCEVVSPSTRELIVRFNNHFYHQTMKNVSALPPLLYLEIHAYSIRKDQVKKLPSSLQFLLITSWMTTTDDWNDEFDHLVNLKTLRLEFKTDGMFVRISPPTQLVKLFTSVSCVYFKNPLPNLVSLSTKRGSDDSHQYANFPCLKILDLSFCIDRLNSIVYNFPITLEHLDISHTSISENVLLCLPPRLICLNINGCINIGDLKNLPGSIRNLIIDDLGDAVLSISQDHKLEVLQVIQWTVEIKLPQILPNSVHSVHLDLYHETSKGDGDKIIEVLQKTFPTLYKISVKTITEMYGTPHIDIHHHDMDSGFRARRI